MKNYKKLHHTGESFDKFQVRLLYTCSQNGFKSGTMRDMADFIANNNLVDVFESFNPVGEPKDDFSQLAKTPDAVCSQCGTLFVAHKNTLYPDLCFMCIARKSLT